ncbi:CdaR family protein [Pyrinomonas sp.]|uniref:CdaR family protein n=1 Tax=Pyrinomonas sp. TaxID=2080306 RepID=UPI003320C679
MNGRETKFDATEAWQAVRRWTHALLFDDWALKALALAIALALWFAVAGQRTPATIRLRGVPLVFLLPENVEIGNAPRDEIEVTLRGTKGALDALNVRNLVATVDLHGYELGERVLVLTPERISMELPDGVSIEDIEPDRLPLRLERRVEREVAVEPHIEGTLPDGYEIRRIQVIPDRVKIRGPESHVEALQKVTTESILLSGRQASFTVPQATINISDAKVVALEPSVAVRIEIAEQAEEKKLSNVVVESDGARPAAPRATVVVRGPRSVIESLRAEDLTLRLERSEDGTVRPRLGGPADAVRQLEILSVSPKSLESPN